MTWSTINNSIFIGWCDASLQGHSEQAQSECSMVCALIFLAIDTNVAEGQGSQAIFSPTLPHHRMLLIPVLDHTDMPTALNRLKRCVNESLPSQRAVSIVPTYWWRHG